MKSLYNKYLSKSKMAVVSICHSYDIDPYSLFAPCNSIWMMNKVKQIQLK